jgi:hypothetical protein
VMVVLLALPEGRELGIEDDGVDHGCDLVRDDLPLERLEDCE